MTGEQTRDDLLAMDDEDLSNYVARFAHELPMSGAFVMRLPNTDTPLILEPNATAEDIRAQLRSASTTRRQGGMG